MRRFLSILKVAAVETMSQPLSAILFPSAVAAVHLLPSFQYHRFGVPGRLAKEAGLSALFVFGLFFAVPAAVHAIRRDIDRGTASAALASGVSRSLYFTARVLGVCSVFALFAAALWIASALSAFSCEHAAELAAAGGNEVQRVWGPAFAAGCGGAVMSMAVAAALNRFFRFRFCVWTCLLAAAFQLPGLAMSGGFAKIAGLFPNFCALSFACFAYIALAAALATRLKESSVSVCAAAAAVAGFLAPVRFLAPDMDIFWIANGASAATPVAAGTALAAMWIALGCLSFGKLEIG